MELFGVKRRNTEIFVFCTKLLGTMAGNWMFFRTFTPRNGQAEVCSEKETNAMVRATPSFSE